MIIIKEPHNNKDASGSVTIMEEVSQSSSEGSGRVFAPGLYGPDVSPPDLLDKTFRPMKFWIWTFNPLTFWTFTFRSPDFWDQTVSPRNSLARLTDRVRNDLKCVEGPGPGRFALGRFGQNVSPLAFWTKTFRPLIIVLLYKMYVSGEISVI